MVCKQGSTTLISQAAIACHLNDRRRALGFSQCTTSVVGRRLTLDASAKVREPHAGQAEIARAGLLVCVRVSRKTTNSSGESGTKLTAKDSFLPSHNRTTWTARARSLGFPLHPFHRRLLAEVADGGFGTSDEIYGVGSEGHRDDDLGGGLVEVRSTLGAGDTGFLAMLATPLADLGCGAWLYVDSSSEDGRLLLATGGDVYRTEHDIRSWFRLWLDARASRAIFFDASQAPKKTGINPFTREPMVYVGEGPPFGELIHRWPEEV